MVTSLDMKTNAHILTEIWLPDESNVFLETKACHTSSIGAAETSGGVLVAKIAEIVMIALIVKDSNDNRDSQENPPLSVSSVI